MGFWQRCLGCGKTDFTPDEEAALGNNRLNDATVGPLQPGLYVIEIDREVDESEMESVHAALRKYEPAHRFLILANGARLARETTAAASVWAEIEGDPDAVASIKEGLADLADGRLVPFADIQPGPDSDDGSDIHTED